MAATLSRRSLLVTALALTASGCSRALRTGSPVAASAACSNVHTLPIYVPVTANRDAAAFEAFDPSLYPLPASAAALCSVTAAGTRVCYGSGEALWDILTAAGWQPPVRYYTLDSVLQTANVDPSTLLPHTLSAFQYLGSTWALPASVTPVGVAYRPDVFTAAHLPPPAPDWTVADFEAACARIWRLAQAGHIPGCYGPLQAFTGNSTHYNPQIRAFTRVVPALTAALWTGFVAGYGGSFLHNGRFDLAGAGATLGLSELVRIWRTYAMPKTVSADGAAMLFVPYPQAPAGLPGFQIPPAPSAYPRKYARFPVLPVRRAVPATVYGWRLNRPGLYPTAPTTALNAVVQFALWSWKRTGQAPASAGAPPVLADPNVQRTYWQTAERAATGASLLGDYTDYVYMDEGFPPVFTSTETTIATALTSAIVGTTDVPTALSTATQQLNAAAAQYQTDREMQAQGQQQRSSTYGQFGAAVQPPHPPAGPVVRVCRS